MKTTCEITLGNASIKLSANLEGEKLTECLTAGLASLAYRGAASKAFKGIKDRTALSYPDTVSKLTPVFKDAGWTAEFTPYTPDSLKKEWEEMERVIDAATAAKKLDALCKKFNVSNKLPKPEMAKAIVAARKTELDDLLK